MHCQSWPFICIPRTCLFKKTYFLCLERASGYSDIIAFYLHSNKKNCFFYSDHRERVMEMDPKVKILNEKINGT